ncbi:MAG: hypothetical protein ACOYMG_19570 [Candidatus Methylumidiphilus sp.]
MNISYSITSEVNEDLPLSRRGIEHGWIKVEKRPVMPAALAVKRAWQNNETIFLPAILADTLPFYQSDIAQANRLMGQVQQGAELSELLEVEIYDTRLQPAFELSGCSYEDNDGQAIEKVIFDSWEGDEMVADNLWCKASWLSFHEEDGSLRFRFSFGIEGYEDVAADPARQDLAAKLTDAIFPESAAVTRHPGLNAMLQSMLDCERVGFMERIVYFNAPNGGAQMHHDVERGHEGVVFAQLSGSTFWLALAKPKLLDEIGAFLAEAPADQWPQLRELAADRQALSEYLEEPDHEWAEDLIDRTPGFSRHLLERGYAHVLEPGDVLLMPQQSLDTCVWHSVICLGDETGEGLSFALKRMQKEGSA